MTRTLLLLPLCLLGCPKDPVDSGPEGDTDADADADTDTDGDADADADADTDPGLWEHCPSADAYVGDGAWTGTLEVAADAVWCGGFDESRTLEEELAAKALLRLVEGTYAVPTEPGDHTIALAACTRRAPGLPTQEMDGAGSTAVSQNTWSGTTYTYLNGAQPMSEGWSLEHTLCLVGDEGAEPGPLVLDGGPADPTTGAGADFILVPEGGSMWDPTAVGFVPCFDADTWHREQHTVTFEGGDITLELWIGQSMASTEPGAFTRASGALDGTTFDLSAYLQLIYNPEHHHFTRHFAVIFDAPIGDACALRVEDVDPWDEGPTARVSTADCDLAVLAARAVSAEGYSRED
ncbi:MAG: hypothetical protein ABIO70_08245 [Pseudomonadota bacterium]